MSVGTLAEGFLAGAFVCGEVSSVCGLLVFSILDSSVERCVCGFVNFADIVLGMRVSVVFVSVKELM